MDICTQKWDFPNETSALLSQGVGSVVFLVALDVLAKPIKIVTDTGEYVGKQVLKVANNTGKYVGKKIVDAANELGKSMENSDNFRHYK
jgi:hypothetical protein